MANRLDLEELQAAQERIEALRKEPQDALDWSMWIRWLDTREQMGLPVCGEHKRKRFAELCDFLERSVVVPRIETEEPT